MSYELIDMERITVLFLDRERQHLIFSHSKDAQDIQIPIGEGIAGNCAQTGEMIIVDDCYEDPRFNYTVDVHTVKYVFHNYLTLCITAIFFNRVFERGMFFAFPSKTVRTKLLQSYKP
jgi:hypothetical protein